MMPIMSTRCCMRRGTLNCAMISTNTKRLSIERLYSVSQPATNSPPASAPAMRNMSPAKMSASVT